MRLKNLKKAPMEIASLLAADEKVIKLIYNDSPSALTESFSPISMQDLINQDYIGFYPAIESGIKDIERNTFIIINTEDFALAQNGINTTVSGAIYVTTDKAHSLLTNGAIRLLELVDAIDSCLENQKLSSAGKISLVDVQYVTFSDFRCGYRIGFRLIDQQSRKAEL